MVTSSPLKLKIAENRSFAELCIHIFFVMVLNSVTWERLKNMTCGVIRSNSRAYQGGKQLQHNCPHQMSKFFLEVKALPFISIIYSYTPSWVWVIVDFFSDVVFFWVRNFIGRYNYKTPLQECATQLEMVELYSDWKAITDKIDNLTNMDLWRENFISKHYDYVLVDERTRLLKQAQKDQNSQLIMSLLRAGLIRNFAGISQKRLFLKSYRGTKLKIEEYITEVLNCFNYLNELLSARKGGDIDEYIMNSKQLKLDFFHDARQSFGSTALLLQGGSLFGLCHLGVVKALYFKGLLPRIIGGSAVGAAVASLVCTLTDEELVPILMNITNVMQDIDILNHDVDERYGNMIGNVIKKGYSQEILIFLKFVRDTIGDLTFEDAYLKTEKILNIVVHPTHQSIPSLLNYITAPNVIIWTAIYASIGTGVLSDNVQLYVKDFNNEIVLKAPELEVVFLQPQDVVYHQQYFHYLNPKKGGKKTSNIKKSSHMRSPGTRGDSPYTRLTELFNVNHFVISLARPYLAPFISNDLKHYHVSNSRGSFFKCRKRNSFTGTGDGKSKGVQISPKPTISDNEKNYTRDSSHNFAKHLKNLVGMEIEHRLMVMNKMGMLADFMKRLFIDEKSSSLQSLSNSRELTIVPELKYLFRDFGRVFEVHKTMENIPYWILVGERLVWPLFPLLWTRCSIEFALDDLYNLHRKRG